MNDRDHEKLIEAGDVSRPVPGEVLDVAMEAGQILLENGAELFRVEETVARICRHFGVESQSAYLLSNGIFLSAGAGADPRIAKVRQVPVRGAQLQRVVAVNQLSREVEKGGYTLAQVREKLEQIRAMPGAGPGWQVLLAGIGSACFAVMFDGGALESACAFVIGMLLQCYLLPAQKRLSKIVEYIGGGMLITLLGLLFWRIAGFASISLRIAPMISGALMTMVPGLAFTNGIRDIAGGDYLSGTVRMIDAALVFLSIAAGMGLVIGICRSLTGGAPL